MKTIDVRVLVNDEVNDDAFVEQLISATWGPGAPLAATLLVEDTSTWSKIDSGCREPKVPSVIHRRHDAVVEWNGDE